MTQFLYSLLATLCFVVKFTYQAENVCPELEQKDVRNGTYPKWEKLQSSYTYVNLTWVIVGNYSEDNIKSFTLYHTQTSSEDWKSVSLPSNSTFYVVKSLEPAKTYRFQLAALLESEQIGCSSFKQSKTLGWTKPCDCNSVGSNSTKCDIKTGLCPCKNKGTVGRTCDKCDKKWIWHDKLGCVKCGCAEDDRSNGTCYYDENNIQQCGCFGHFAGPNCQSCAYGYYASPDVTHNCISCECNNNTDPAVTKICDPRTGECLGCSFGTEGTNCEICKEGYEGSGVYRNCTVIGARNPIHVTTSRSSSLTIIIGICVSIGAVFVLAVGICMARRVCWRKPPMQLWTVELKDDHENVSFNSMLENPEYQNPNASLLMDDVQFYGHSTPVYQPVVQKAELRRSMGYHTIGERNAET